MGPMVDRCVSMGGQRQPDMDLDREVQAKGGALAGGLQAEGGVLSGALM
jgi:hypothetical protein